MGEGERTLLSFARAAGMCVHCTCERELVMQYAISAQWSLVHVHCWFCCLTLCNCIMSYSTMLERFYLCKNYLVAGMY